MQITSATRLSAPPTRSAEAPAPQPPQPEKPDAFVPQKPYEPWVPLANAATVGALVGIPSAVGALENQLFGPAIAGGLTVWATPLAAGVICGGLAARSAKKEFNGHPILVGLSALACGGAAAAAAPFLKIPGAAFGWQGAAVATAVSAVGAGVISAFGIHAANQKIAEHNAQGPHGG